MLDMATSSGGSASGSEDEASQALTLYFGSLSPHVAQSTLQSLCECFGPIDNCKIIKDKATSASAGYGFVKFVDRHGAEAALQALNGQSYLGEELRVNWALPNNHKEDSSYHYHIFVGDLGSDVTDAVLYNTFCTVGQCSDARVMWDHNTGRSKGYGFVSYRRKEDAEAAIEVMQSRQLGSRRIRVGWAQHKQEENVTPLDFDTVDRADPANTNIYIGNISPETSEAGLTNHFAVFGPVAEVKLHKKGGYGFVKFEHHKSAVKAIVGQHSRDLDGRFLKCSWGKNITSARTANASASSALSLAAALQSTHLSGTSSPAISLGHPSTQSVMASLAAAAAAANAAVSAAAAAGPMVGPFGVSPDVVDGSQTMAAAASFGPGAVAFLPSAPAALPCAFFGLPPAGSAPSALRPPTVGATMRASHSHMQAAQAQSLLRGGQQQGMLGANPWMLQAGLSQMSPTQMALATQMMMMQQELQTQQHALDLQMTLSAAAGPLAHPASAFRSASATGAMGMMPPPPPPLASLAPAAAITSGNISLDPPRGGGGAGFVYPLAGHDQYGGLYGMGGPQRMQMHLL